MTAQRDDILAQLSALGVAVWLDDISRERLVSGGLADLVANRHVVGVTSNPTIFANAVSQGSAYDEQIADLAARKIGADEAGRAVTTYDVRWACDLLRPAYDASGGVDGRVSLEVDPRLARDTRATIAEARALWWILDRPNAYIKIPATREGLPAITQCLSEGISINVTLIFSLQRYREVVAAFLAGMEQAAANGHDLAKITSVASFFVSRVDTEVDKRLDKIGSDEAKALRGKAGIANARLAYEIFEEQFATPRWQALAAKGARVQRPLWASTSTKDPAYPDTMYVTELAVADTVNTMPESTILATADHAPLRGDAVHGTYEASREVFEALERLGISYDDVVGVLEDEGVSKFAASWQQFADTISAELAKAAGQ